jgi:hypothetical protein
LWIKKATGLGVTKFTLRFTLVSIIQDDKELSTTYGEENCLRHSRKWKDMELE